MCRDRLVARRLAREHRPPVVHAVKRVATRPLDVHLMIEDPDRYIEAFVKAGAHCHSG